jgi:hypothetical protein
MTTMEDLRPTSDQVGSELVSRLLNELKNTNGQQRLFHDTSEFTQTIDRQVGCLCMEASVEDVAVTVSAATLLSFRATAAISGGRSFEGIEKQAIDQRLETEHPNALLLIGAYDTETDRFTCSVGDLARLLAMDHSQIYERNN